MFKLLKIQYFKIHNVIKIYYNPMPNTEDNGRSLNRSVLQEITKNRLIRAVTAKRDFVGLHGVGYSFRNAEISETGHCAICLLLVIFLALGSERMEMSLKSRSH